VTSLSGWKCANVRIMPHRGELKPNISTGRGGDSRAAVGESLKGEKDRGG